MKRLLSALLLFGAEAGAFDLLAGVSLGHRTLTFRDMQYDRDTAEFQSGTPRLAPSVSLRSEPDYLWQDGNWAYTFSADFFTTGLTKQRLPDSGRLEDVGTRIDGLTLFLTPLLYYQFNRKASHRWQYRAGMGAGIGYQGYEGTFRITDADHPDVGTIRPAHHHGIGLSAGVYLEAAYGRHHFLLNGDLLATRHSGYRYLENNLRVKYQYRVFGF